jgi:hypothetical protein
MNAQEKLSLNIRKTRSLISAFREALILIGFTEEKLSCHSWFSKGPIKVRVGRNCVDGLMTVNGHLKAKFSGPSGMNKTLSRIAVISEEIELAMEKKEQRCTKTNS